MLIEKQRITFNRTRESIVTGTIRQISLRRLDNRIAKDTKAPHSKIIYSREGVKRMDNKHLYLFLNLIAGFVSEHI